MLSPPGRNRRRGFLSLLSIDDGNGISFLRMDVIVSGSTNSPRSAVGCVDVAMLISILLVFVPTLGPRMDAWLVDLCANLTANGL